MTLLYWPQVNENKKTEISDIEAKGQVVSDKVFFMRQLV